MKLTLKQARQIGGFTQKEFAFMIGVCRDTYVKLEKAPDLVTIGQAKKISQFTKISYEDIFFQ